MERLYNVNRSALVFAVAAGVVLCLGAAEHAHAAELPYQVAEWKPGERLAQRRTNVSSSGNPSIEVDLEIGAHTEAEILSDPSSYPILSRSQAPDAYAMLDRMRSTILDSGKLQYASAFPWKIHIIDDDSTANAFATAGGYVYVYTGMFKALDNEAQLAGVMGHEFAHAELRHSVEQMQLSRLQTLLSRLRSDRQRRRAVSALVSAQYSQRHEAESDMASVQYLCGSEWNAAEFARFFSGQSESRAPGYFSSHPPDANRAAAIEAEAARLGCSGDVGSSSYQAISNAL